MNRLFTLNGLNLLKRRPFTTTARNPAAIKQELPPPGGYQSVPYARVPAKKLVSGVTLFAAYVIVNFTAAYLWILTQRQRKLVDVENDSTILILEPMLMAEKDRKYLKILRRNRELEEQIMKDVPGWEVGTYFGEPIYNTRPKDEWHDVLFDELFLHAFDMDKTHHYNVPKYH